MTITISIKNILFVILLIAVVAILVYIAIPPDSGHAFYPTATPWPIKLTPTPVSPNYKSDCPTLILYDLPLCTYTLLPMVIR